MKRALLFVASVALLSACDSAPTGLDPGPDPAASLTTVSVAFTGGAVSAEIAATQAGRSIGLMNRATIAADSGMLFVWPTNQSNQAVAFHMLNTHFDLSIAFLDANHVVLNIEDMDKDTDTFHFAVAPFRYALEAPRGWFASHGVTAGAIATFTLPAGVIIEP
ncbi:MAG: DUF192 domain-containing protein [Gemmatimonadetes bacterium]|nr:DUF192 domain-containing protein [Gemmatimonadota bacterium]